jgi:hypothetical protein
MRRMLPCLIYPLIWIVIACADPGPTGTAEESSGLRGGGVEAQNDESDDSESDDDDEGDTDDDEGDTDDDEGEGDDDDDGDGDDDNAVECKFRVPLTGAEEVPPRATQASGVARIRIEGDEIEFDVRIANPAGESFTAGHIHGRAPRGANAGVVRFLYPTVAENTEFESRGFPTGNKLRVEGEGSIAPTLAADICAQPELFYVNFHTTQFTGGAIRGQLR